jgi:hypothetical protein
MTKLQDQIRRIAGVAVAISAVALMSGCATKYNGAQRLDRWEPGETRDFMIVRGVHQLEPEMFQNECKEGKIGSTTSDSTNATNWIGYFKEHVCSNQNDWQRFSGFIKSDFGKGAIFGRGLIRPGLKIEVDDIIEISQQIGEDGRITRPALAVRVIRKNALKERDPTCYWDGQSGRFDAFATGGVVCPAEGWDWREQKWAKK